MASAAGGKGSAPRPLGVSKEQFESNWDRIFGKKQQEETSSQEERSETASQNKGIEA